MFTFLKLLIDTLHRSAHIMNGEKNWFNKRPKFVKCNGFCVFYFDLQFSLYSVKCNGGCENDFTLTGNIEDDKERLMP